MQTCVQSLDRKIRKGAKAHYSYLEESWIEGLAGYESMGHKESNRLATNTLSGSLAGLGQQKVGGTGEAPGGAPAVAPAGMGDVMGGWSWVLQTGGQASFCGSEALITSRLKHSPGDKETAEVEEHERGLMSKAFMLIR